MEKEKIFQVCKLYYQKAYDNIMSMATIVGMDKKNNINVKVVTLSFDLVMQFSLLQIAASDLNFDRDEMKFIRNLTHHDSLMEIFNKTGQKNLTWDYLLKLETKSLRELLAKYENEFVKLSKEFTNIFAYIDAATPNHNYTKDFKEQVNEIMEGLSKIDESVDDVELRKSCVMKKALANIEKMKKKMQ